jgi:arylsulfatase
MGAPDPVGDGGFDRSYTLDDHDRNFNPQRHREDDRPLPPVAKEGGYYSSTAFADHAIRCLQEHAAQHAGQPFFSYLAFTVPHFPLQAPPEDIARYRDRYLAGWTAVRAERYRRQKESGLLDCALSAPEPQLRAPSGGPGIERKVGPDEIAQALVWEGLTEGQQRFQATKMAIHAAMIDRMDQEIGRVLKQVEAMGALDNTVILFLSDNGASAEILVRGDGQDPAAPPGSAASFLCLGPGWSTVANTPFRRHKIWTHEGGIATPLIVHWPQGLAARNDIRRDACHVIDLVPTLLELAGASPEAQAGAPALPGRSLVPALAGDGRLARDQLFFHHAGNRALRAGDFKLVSSRDDGNVWELYDLASDRAEMRNLAGAQPDRVRDLAARWQALQDQFTRDAGPVLGTGKQAERKSRP